MADAVSSPRPGAEAPPSSRPIDIAAATGTSPRGAGPQLAVENAPAWLRALAIGSELRATVIDGEPGEPVTVRTSRGLIALSGLGGARPGQPVWLIVAAKQPLLALTLSRSAPAPALLRAGAVLTGQYVSQLPIAPGRPTGAVWQIPPTADLLEVRPGTVLTGKLVQAPNGERAVRTAAGTLPVSPNLPASTGAQLRLGVLSAEAPLTLALLSQRPPLLTAIKQWVQSWTGRAGGSSDAAGGNDSALSMRVATVRVPAASVPPATPPTASAAPAVASAAPLAASAAPAAASAAPAAASPAPPATAMTAPASAPAAAVAAPQSPAMMSGVVTASRAHGLTEIHTNSGVLTVRLAQPATPGTHVTFEPLNRGGATVPLTVAAFAARTLHNLSPNWPALRDTLQALQAAEPAIAAQTMATIPHTGPRLASGIVLFLTALLGTDLQDWLGRHPVRALQRRGHTVLPNRLSEEFTQLARLSQTPISGDWRAIPIPMLHDGALQQLRLYLRRPPAGAKRDEAEGMRFVVEAALSHIGPIQLDGLVRGPRLDLVVRTAQELPELVRNDIADIFDEARSLVREPGRISFNVTQPFPVDFAGTAPTDAVGVVA